MNRLREIKREKVKGNHGHRLLSRKFRAPALIWKYEKDVNLSDGARALSLPLLLSLYVSFFDLCPFDTHAHTNTRIIYSLIIIVVRGVFGAAMASSRSIFVLALLIVNAVLVVETEAGVVQKVKDTFSSIKNYFRHGHSQHEHCDQSKEDISENTIEGSDGKSVLASTTTTTTTTFPQIDIRNGFDDEQDSSSRVPKKNDRRLIVPGVNNDCPDGERKGYVGRCRPEV